MKQKHSKRMEIHESFSWHTVKIILKYPKRKFDFDLGIEISAFLWVWCLKFKMCFVATVVKPKWWFAMVCIYWMIAFRIDNVIAEFLMRFSSVFLLARWRAKKKLDSVCVRLGFDGNYGFVSFDPAMADPGVTSWWITFCLDLLLAVRFWPARSGWMCIRGKTFENNNNQTRLLKRDLHEKHKNRLDTKMKQTINCTQQ